MQSDVGLHPPGPPPPWKENQIILIQHDVLSTGLFLSSALVLYVQQKKQFYKNHLSLACLHRACFSGEAPSAGRIWRTPKNQGCVSVKETLHLLVRRGAMGALARGQAPYLGGRFMSGSVLMAPLSYFAFGSLQGMGCWPLLKAAILRPFPWKPGNVEYKETCDVLQ